MQYKYKRIEMGKDAREDLRVGIDKVADIVKSTLGPHGRNVMIEIKRRAPLVTNDGVTIAKHIVLKDEQEDLGAQSIIDVATKTNDMVGDGTTTAVVLAQAIINNVMKEIEEKESIVGQKDLNVIEIYKRIKDSCKNIVEKLKEKAVPVKTKEDIERVAVVSMQNEEYGKIVADMRNEVGLNGHISVEENFKKEIEHEVVNGMKFVSGYASFFLSTNRRKEAVWENAAILVTNHALESIKLLDEIMVKVNKHLKKQWLVIIASKFDKTVLPVIIATTMRSPNKILAIKGVSLTTEGLEDVACYVGARFIDREKGESLDDIKPEDFGEARKVVADKDNTIIIDGKGDKEEIKKRIEKLEEHLKIEKVEMFEKKIRIRIGSLSAGIGLIKVGANSDAESSYLRHKFIDAVHASKAAMEEGVVKGGGLALKEISEELSEDDILKKPILAPWELIQELAGGKLKIGKDIVDPLKVVRVALENACSMAGTLITTESIICWDKHNLEEQLKDLGFIQKEEN